LVTKRGPVFEYGNKRIGIYGPVKSNGRGTIIDWVPTHEDKTEIIRTMFRGYLAESEQARIEVLVDRFSGGEFNLPIAFYEVLRNSIFDDIIIDTIRGSDRLPWPEISRAVESTRPVL